MTIQLHRIVLAAGAAALFAGCPNPSLVVDADPETKECTASAQCGNGTVCLAGACTPGACDPALEGECDGGSDSEYCCKVWENCDGLSLTCVRDEDSPIGCRPNEPDCAPCEVDDDCPTAGQFCSGGRCFDTAGREGCTSSFQCPAGERCDRTVFLCVPDRGGCGFCDQLTELCCEDGEICSEQDGFCLDIPEAECEEDGDCALGTFCDALQRCSQCDADHACGPNLACDSGTGDCYPTTGVCTSDEGCPGGDGCQCTGAKRCSVSVGQCVVPECEIDSDCVQGGDSRRRCNLESFRCELPPPVCDDEADEPNGAVSNATPMVAGPAYSGKLCRADSDVLSFPVIANRRYTATVDFGGAGQSGIAVAMLDSSGLVESSNVFTQTQASLQVTGVTGETESGLFYVRVIGGNIDRDQWSYDVSVTEQEASPPADCTPQGQPEEPNNTTATAYALPVGTTVQVTRCGTADDDYYTIPVGAQQGIRVTVTGFINAEGNLNATLFRGSNPTAQVDQSVSTNDVEVVDGPEGESSYVLRVRLASTAGALTDQAYSIRADAVARPAECLPDPGEPDDTLATAATITLTDDGDGVLDGEVLAVARCNPQDVDHFRFTMPQNLSGSVLLSFNHNEGDIRLDLYRPDGTSVGSSNVSNAGSQPDEQVAIPGSATEALDYIAKVSLGNATATNIIGQRYDISVVTFDNSQCLASEPSGGDDTFDTGRCVGTFDPPVTPDCVSPVAEPLAPGDLAACLVAPPNTPGCGRLCSNTDDDFYRIGVLNNDQVVRATLTYPIGQGTLSLVGMRLSSTGAATTVPNGTATDSDMDGDIELTFVVTTVAAASAREHAIRVDPTGTTGHQSEPYALSITVGDPCFDDEFDAVANNATPATSSLIRTNPQFGSPFALDTGSAFSPGSSRCHQDTDVYEMFSFSGEDVTVELNGPAGLIAELGSRPADLDDPAELLDTATAGGAPVVFSNGTSRQLYITVKPATGAVVTGPYSLLINTIPP